MRPFIEWDILRDLSESSSTGALVAETMRDPLEQGTVDKTLNKPLRRARSPVGTPRVSHGHDPDVVRTRMTDHDLNCLLTYICSARIQSGI